MPVRRKRSDRLRRGQGEVRFTFPRQPAGKHLCLADFFASRESGRMDVVAFHLVTVGRRASEYSHELFKADNYSDYLYFHGLSVESAEALAELWHKRIREELGIAGADSPDLTRLSAGVSGLALQFWLSGVSATRRSGEAFHAARSGAHRRGADARSFNWSQNNRLRLSLSTIRRRNTSRSSEPRKGTKTVHNESHYELESQ